MVVPSGSDGEVEYPLLLLLRDQPGGQRLESFAAKALSPALASSSPIHVTAVTAMADNGGPDMAARTISVHSCGSASSVIPQSTTLQAPTLIHAVRLFAGCGVRAPSENRRANLRGCRDGDQRPGAPRMWWPCWSARPADSSCIRLSRQRRSRTFPPRGCVISTAPQSEFPMAPQNPLQWDATINAETPGDSPRSINCLMRAMRPSGASRAQGSKAEEWRCIC